MSGNFTILKNAISQYLPDFYELTSNQTDVPRNKRNYYFLSNSSSQNLIEVSFLDEGGPFTITAVKYSIPQLLEKEILGYKTSSRRINIDRFVIKKIDFAPIADSNQYQIISEDFKSPNNFLAWRMSAPDLMNKINTSFLN